MTILYVSAFVGALGCAVTAGILFAFAVAIIPGLRRLPVPEGIASMNAFNDSILNPVFLLVFLVSSAASLGLAASAPLTWHHPGAIWRLVGGLLFFLGVFVVTMAINVPLNDSLAAVDPYSTQGAQVWDHYQATWTVWNDIRTIAGIAAAASLIRALL
jgi:uncharacterized membrane protein